MARNGAYQNHKGFFHHPDTPSEDKALYIQNQDKAIALLRLGTAFLEGGVVEHRSWCNPKSDIFQGADFGSLLF